MVLSNVYAIGTGLLRVCLMVYAFQHGFTADHADLQKRTMLHMMYFSVADGLMIAIIIHDIFTEKKKCN